VATDVAARGLGKNHLHNIFHLHDVISICNECITDIKNNKTILFLLKDVENISTVINFDFPNDIDNYIHRIGRTARGDKQGRAYSFLTDEDTGKARDLMDILRDSKQQIPEELIQMSQHSKLESF
jgi:superfamily II DNA/RNA helicase